MTRRHFEALARELSIVLDKADHPIERVAVKDAIDAVAHVCREFNGRFDRTKFLRACGV